MNLDIWRLDAQALQLSRLGELLRFLSSLESGVQIGYSSGVADCWIRETFASQLNGTLENLLPR